jgi:DNA mismatch repair protein MutS
MPGLPSPGASLAVPASQFLEDLAALDLNHITPLQALNFINTWKALLDGKPAVNRPAHRQQKAGDKTPSLFEF